MNETKPRISGPLLDDRIRTQSFLQLRRPTMMPNEDDCQGQLLSSKSQFHKGNLEGA